MTPFTCRTCDCNCRLPILSRTAASNFRRSSAFLLLSTIYETRHNAVCSGARSSMAGLADALLFSPYQSNFASCASGCL